MAMPAPSHPPRRNGCLWGCVAVFLVVALPFVLAAGYGGWFLWRGYRHDPAVRLARELVMRDGLARRVLGSPIAVTGVQANGWSWMPGTGRTSSAVLMLSGPRGEGTLEIHAHAERGGQRLDEATLTGPGGVRYDLLHRHTLPGGDLDDTI
jgi:hypothetical protein